MDIQELLKINNLNTIEQLFNFIKHEISYGWLDQKGNQHPGINNALEYYLQSPEELLINKIGICWDITELSRCFFENMTTFKIETYYLFYEDNKGCPSHTILVFYKEDKVYWFEAMFNNPSNDESGIYKYYNIEFLLKDFIKKFIHYQISENKIPKNYKKENIKLYQYTKPLIISMAMK